jgi:hypothetical protein
MQSQIAPSRPWHTPFALSAIIFVALLWYPVAALAAAEDPAGSMFSFSGFGTVGTVHSSDDQADFVGASLTQPKGAGFSNRWSETPDTKLGAQVIASFTEKLTAVVQIVSQYQYDGTFMPDVDWANLKYQITPDLDIRVGRIGLPTYMFSDTLNVGYTLPFVRIPQELYSQLPIDQSDGMDGSYRLRLGEVTNTVQVYAGYFDSKIPNGFYNIGDIKGIADSVEFGAATLHFSYQSLRWDMAIPGFVVHKDPQSLLSVGVNYDPGKWFVYGEWIRASDEQFGRFFGGTLFGGYRIHQFTPYVGYSSMGMGDAGSSGSPPWVDQSSDTMGVRWDVLKNTDLKLQLDHTVKHGGLQTYFINQQPGFKTFGTVNLISIALDFVF